MQESKTNGIENKTETIDALATIIRSGYGCIGMMGSESPFIVIRLDDGREIKWHSDNVEAFINKFHGKRIGMYSLEGKSIGVSMKVRGNKVWRMVRFYFL